MPTSSGFSKWLIFTGTLFTVTLVLYVLWAERFGAEVGKAVLSFIVLAAGAFVLNSIGTKNDRQQAGNDSE